MKLKEGIREEEIFYALMSRKKNKGLMKDEGMQYVSQILHTRSLHGTFHK